MPVVSGSCSTLARSRPVMQAAIATAMPAALQPVTQPASVP
jgi:hypothetical protein